MIVENYHGINIIEFPDKFTKDLWGLKYHSSWDWLMPVWKKITDISPVFDEYKECDTIGYEAYQSVPIFLELVEILRVHEYIVNFIKWYNNK